MPLTSPLEPQSPFLTTGQWGSHHHIIVPKLPLAHLAVQRTPESQNACVRHPATARLTVYAVIYLCK